MGNHFLEASTTFQLHHLFLQQAASYANTNTMADENKNTKKVVKSVTGKKYTEDENKQHKLLLGLGCALITAGAALTGWAGDKVRTYNKENK